MFPNISVASGMAFFPVMLMPCLFFFISMKFRNAAIRNITFRQELWWWEIWQYVPACSF